MILVGCAFRSNKFRGRREGTNVAKLPQRCAHTPRHARPPLATVLVGWLNAAIDWFNRIPSHECVVTIIIEAPFGVLCFGRGYLTAFIVTRNKWRDEIIKRGADRQMGMGRAAERIKILRPPRN